MDLIWYVFVMPLLFMTGVVLSPFIVTYLVYQALFQAADPEWTILAYNERDGPDLRIKIKIYFMANDMLEDYFEEVKDESHIPRR